jgi:hypothetical protein
MKPQSTATWSPKQERVALLIAAGRTIKAAAAEAGCGERTAHEWLDDAQYRLLVSRFRRRLIDRAVGSLARSTNKAVFRLRKLLDSENENVRLRAAVSLLDHAVRMREHGELEDRITALEARDHESEEPDFEAGEDEGDEDAA